MFTFPNDFVYLFFALGTYEELMKNEGTFAEYLTQYLKNSDDDDDDTSIEEQLDDKFTFNPRSISRTISARTDSKTNDSKLFKRSVSHGSGSADLKKSKKWQLFNCRS